ncbi:MAG TPA: hypothetical protein DCF63_06905 [Planctomycetaceae bacterium]|nr:hypothetical protein [Planctomycetaceae bacterium]
MIQQPFARIASRFKTKPRQRVQRRARLRSLLIEHLEDRKLLAAIHPLPLSGLNGLSGFRLEGVALGDNSGYSVSSAGDVNGDGFEDMIVGANGKERS